MATGFIAGLDAINYALDGIGESRVVAAQMSTNHIARQYLTLLNEILRIFYTSAVNWGYLKRKYSLSTVANTQYYNLTTAQSGLYIDRVYQKEVTHEDGYVIEHITHEQYRSRVIPQYDYDPDGATISSGKPAFWFEDANMNDSTGKTFGLYPIPNSVQVITIPYRTSLTDPITTTTISDDLLIPHRDINPIICGCRWKFSQRLERPVDFVREKEREFLEELTSSTVGTAMLQDDGRLPVDEYFMQQLLESTDV